MWEGGGEQGGRGGGEDDAAGVTAPAEPRARGGGGDGVVAERAGTPQPQRAPASPLAWVPIRPTVSAQVRCKGRGWAFGPPATRLLAPPSRRVGA